MRRRVAAHASAGPVYVRIGKRAVPDLPGPAFEVGRARLVRDGEDLAFIATGETVWLAYAAAERLAQEGIQCRVLSMHTLRPFDSAAVLEAAGTRGILDCRGAQHLRGARRGVRGRARTGRLTVPFRSIGLPDEETVPGSQTEILDHYGMSAAALAEAARNLLQAGRGVRVPHRRRRHCRETRRRGRSEHVRHEGDPVRRVRPCAQPGRPASSADLSATRLGRARRRGDLRATSSRVSRSSLARPRKPCGAPPASA